jgi:nifR3 family TIM-barrel protein
VRLGRYELSSNLFLSPLAGYTNLPMRLTVRELGGLAWATTDLVNARSLLEKNPTAFKLIASAPGDRPFAVQLFGSVPEEMRDAAQLCESLGAESVDINMGCPVRKVVQIGGGSAMMTELKKTAALVRGMVAAVKIPVTAKMRLGWDDENLTAPDLAGVLEDAGVAAVFVHGRTRAQGFSGGVNLAGIGAVVQAVKAIPVIGNGDITTPEAARHMIAETGCAGVSIGRGAFYDPWIFRRTDQLLRTGELLPEPDSTVKTMGRACSGRSRPGTRSASVRARRSRPRSSRSSPAPISKPRWRSISSGGSPSATRPATCSISTRPRQWWPRSCGIPTIRRASRGKRSRCPRARSTCGDGAGEARNPRQPAPC